MMQAGIWTICKENKPMNALHFSSHELAGGTGRRTGQRLAGCTTPRGRVA